MKNKKRKGFTLIELLVTLAVIAIITTITFVVINNVNNVSKDVVVMVNKETLTKAAITYVQEFKMSEVWDKTSQTSTDEFVCISVNQLKNKGYFKGNLKDEDGNSLDATTLKITRNSNKVIQNEIAENSDDCINVPTVEMKIAGTTTLYNGKNWYYKIEDASITLKLNRELGYFPISLTYKGVNIDVNKFEKVSDADYEYRLRLSEVGDIENHGGVVQIKVNVGADDNVASASQTINADFKRPTKPTLTAGDGVTSGNWHEGNFNLNISTSVESPSGNYYKYGYSSTNINTKVQNKIENIDKETSRTIYVKTCNNLNVCSEDYTTYKIIKKPKIEILLEGPTKSYNSKEWYYDSSNTKIKLTITSETSNFTKTLKFGNETITLPKVSPSNNVYTYSVKLSDITNVAKYGENTIINASVTLNGKTIPVSKTINVDVTTPNKPTLTASDGRTSGKWHAEDFDLNVSGGGTSPSGIYYMYGYDKSSINTKVNAATIPVSENSSATIYVKTCNNVGKCSNNTEYKTLSSVTLTNAEVVFSYGKYFEDSIVSIENVKYAEGDLKLKNIYYAFKYKPKTIEDFAEYNPTNSRINSAEIRQSSYMARIGLVDTAGNVQFYYIGYADPGAIRRITTVNKEYHFSQQYLSEVTKNYFGIGAYDELAGILLQSKDFKFENNKLEYTIFSTGAAEWKKGYITEPGNITLGTVSGCMNSNLSSSWTCPYGGSPKKINGKWMCTLNNNLGFSYCYDKYGNKLDNCTDSRAPWSMPGFEGVYLIYPKFTNIGCKCTNNDIGKQPTEFVYEQGGCPLYADEVPNFSSGPNPGGPYPMNNSNNCPICTKTGVFYDEDYYLEQVAFCKWNDYEAVCKTPTYTCPSGTVYQVEDYCYSCKAGGTNVEGSGYCKYTGTTYYKYEVYEGYVEKEIERYLYTYGG